MDKLKGIRVAMLATNGFEESELFEPKKALEENGAQVDIVAPEGGKIKAWKHGEWSREIKVDVLVDNADANSYDALVIPGGVINPDKLRRNKKAVDFVSSFFSQQKNVASICHGPQMLIEAEAVKNRKLTSFFSIKKDLQNAGAKWVDEEVVVDDKLITSRNPDDLNVFNKTLVEKFSEIKKE
jgi:protease I